MKNELERQLFLMQIEDVKGEKGLLRVKMQVRYRLPISLTKIRSIFSGGSGAATFETVRELVKPVEYKWDYDLLQDK